MSGKNRLTFEEMIDLDIHYARRKSLGLDLSIMLKTIPALVAQTKDVRQETDSAVPKQSRSER